ncbi:hypothetical protein SAMN05216525_12552 [Bradyrhizobium sp. Gha]|nr:hypothetical protein SAMN05216525_12552 [Bradyrhizobium sp. Gha]
MAKLVVNLQRPRVYFTTFRIWNARASADDATEFRHNTVSKYTDVRNAPLRSLRRRVRARRADHPSAAARGGELICVHCIESCSVERSRSYRVGIIDACRSRLAPCGSLPRHIHDLLTAALHTLGQLGNPAPDLARLMAKKSTCPLMILRLSRRSRSRTRFLQPPDLGRGEPHSRRPAPLPRPLHSSAVSTGRPGSGRAHGDEQHS